MKRIQFWTAASCPKIPACPSCWPALQTSYLPSQSDNQVRNSLQYVSLSSSSHIIHIKFSTRKYLDYFELKVVKAQKTQEETLTFPFSCLKNLNREPVPRMGFHQICLQRIWIRYAFVCVCVCVCVCRGDRT